MTLQQLGSFVNIIGFLFPLVFSLTIAKTYDRPYFLNWTGSYLFFTVVPSQ